MLKAANKPSTMLILRLPSDVSPRLSLIYIGTCPLTYLPPSLPWMTSLMPDPHMAMEATVQRFPGDRSIRLSMAVMIFLALLSSKEVTAQIFPNITRTPGELLFGPIAPEQGGNSHHRLTRRTDRYCARSTREPVEGRHPDAGGEHCRSRNRHR